MSKYEKIIFVCTGNTCKSPMAENIYRSLDTVSEIMVLSKGLVVLFSEPPNQKAVTVMENHNLSLSGHMSTQLTEQDINENTLLLTMSMSQKDNVITDFGYPDNVFTIKEFVGEEGDVSDPYGGSLVDYEDCFLELLRLINRLIYKLNEEA